MQEMEARGGRGDQGGSSVDRRLVDVKLLMPKDQLGSNYRTTWKSWSKKALAVLARTAVRGGTVRLQKLLETLSRQQEETTAAQLREADQVLAETAATDFKEVFMVGLAPGGSPAELIDGTHDGVPKR